MTTDYDPAAAPRQAEIAKYYRAYVEPSYAMGGARMEAACEDVQAINAISPLREYLDVGCGRGEMLDYAESRECPFVRGTEVVPALIDGERVLEARGWALPFADKSFQVVTMFDVIEHLLPGDDEATCAELARVAREFVVLTASNISHKMRSGEELHVNLRPYPEWDGLFREWFAPGRVEFVEPSRNRVSETWRIDFRGLSG